MKYGLIYTLDKLRETLLPYAGFGGVQLRVLLETSEFWSCRMKTFKGIMSGASVSSEIIRGLEGKKRQRECSKEI